MLNSLAKIFLLLEKQTGVFEMHWCLAWGYFPLDAFGGKHVGIKKYFQKFYTSARESQYWRFKLVLLLIYFFFVPYSAIVLWDQYWRFIFFFFIFIFSIPSFTLSLDTFFKSRKKASPGSDKIILALKIIVLFSKWNPVIYSCRL